MKVKLIVAAFALVFAIATSAFTKSGDIKFTTHFSSRLVAPDVPADFDQASAQTPAQIKAGKCPGVNNQICRYYWPVSQVNTVSGVPQSIKIDPTTSAPYVPLVIMGP